MILTYLIAIALVLIGATVFSGSVPAALDWLRRPSPPQMVLQTLVALGAALGVTWLLGVKLVGVTWTELRYREPHAGRGFGVGLSLGLLAACVALALGVAAGGAGWMREAGSAGDYLAQLGKTVGILAPAALAEEVMFRGLPLVLLATALGRGPAVIVMAIVFAAMHLLNPDVSALGLANIAVAGVFLAAAFYAPGGIWTALGAHLGWNAALAAADAPVSGLPFRIPLIDYSAGGPAWLTGGQFGPEGGLTATVAISLATLALIRWAGRKRA